MIFTSLLPGLCLMLIENDISTMAAVFTPTPKYYNIIDTGRNVCTFKLNFINQAIN